MNKLKENLASVLASMVVIAVMPAAGLMISIGKTIMINPNVTTRCTGGFLEQIG